MKFKLSNVTLADGPMLLASNPVDQQIATVASFMVRF
jgi:hypothetical protein